MKKIPVIFFVFLIFLIFLCGCKDNEIDVKTSNISFNCQAKYNNDTYKFAVTVKRKDKAEVLIDSPSDVKGMKLLFNKDSVTIKYMGLTYKPNVKSFPADNMLFMLNDALKKADKAKRNKKSGNYCFFGKYNGEKYEFVFSPSGLPLSLKTNDGSLTMKFGNLTLVK